MDPADPWSIAYGHCRDQWIQAFNEGPHTSFKMIEVILTQLNLKPRDMLHDLTKLSKFQGEWVTGENISSTYLDTWASRTGRCTSFVIRVVDILQRQYPNCGFRFDIFDLAGRHRVGRCQTYGIVVDQESRHRVEDLPSVSGPATLPDKHNPNWRNTPNNERGRWMHYNNQLFFEPRPGGGRQPRSQNIPPMTNAVALGICLQDVAQRAVLVCAFRQARLEENLSMTVIYYGSVRWRLAKRRMELTPNLNREEFSTITFGDGTAETNRDCIFNLTTFVKACGLEHQWKADAIDMFNRRLWGAAILEWGYPVWKAVEHP